jgi:hypothetical protein
MKHNLHRGGFDSNNDNFYYEHSSCYDVFDVTTLNFFSTYCIAYVNSKTNWSTKHMFGMNVIDEPTSH